MQKMELGLPIIFRRSNGVVTRGFFVEYTRDPQMASIVYIRDGRLTAKILNVREIGVRPARGIQADDALYDSNLRKRFVGQLAVIPAAPAAPVIDAVRPFFSRERQKLEFIIFWIVCGVIVLLIVMFFVATYANYKNVSEQASKNSR